MELNSSLRTPSPNKEFRRVSSRSVSKTRTTSPPAGSPGSTNHAEQLEARRILTLPIGSGAGRFSPSQYLGRSSLSRTSTSVSSPNSKLDSSVPGPKEDSAVGERLSKPLTLSQEEVRDARRERSMAEYIVHLSENNLDFIGLKPFTPQKAPQNKPANGDGMSLFTSDTREPSADNGESPPPPPPPMLPPQSPDELRRIKDSQNVLISSPGQHSQRNQRSTPDTVSQPEEEARLRRFRRIQALQEDYRSSIGNTALLSGHGNNSPNQSLGGNLPAVDPTKVLYPLEGKGSATVLAVRQQVARLVSQWLALHTAAAEALDEQIQELSSLRSEHVAMQQQVVASEHILARTGEQNAELLQQLQQAVREAERRVGPTVLDEMLQSYPANWFQPQNIDVPSLAASTSRSRSGSGDYTLSGVLSRSLSRSGTPTRALSLNSTQLAQSRSSTPTSKGNMRRYEMYGNDPVPEGPEGPEHNIRSRSGTPRRVKVDPKVMPAGDAFSAPWSFQIDPEIRDKQVAATSVGHRFYGPPAMQRRYGSDQGQTLGVDNGGATVVSAGGGSRSNSAARSRSGTLTSMGGYTFASDYRSSGLASTTGDLSTVATSGRAVRSTSASRMRAAHNERTIQQRTSPPVKHATARSRSTSPAGGRVAGTLQRTQSEADNQRYQGGRLATVTRPARQGSARNKMDTLFSAEGRVYESGADERSQVNDQGGSYGFSEKHLEQSFDGLGGWQPGSPADYREVARPQDDNAGHLPMSAVQGPPPQPSAQSQRSPLPTDRAKVLARTPSSSALSPRLKEDQPAAPGNDHRPVDISQVRQPSMRRLSDATNSSDASYSGSRYSDIQWDSSGHIARVGHHQPKPTQFAGAVSSPNRPSNGVLSGSQSGASLMQQSLTAASSESDLQGMSLSGVVPWQAAHTREIADAEGSGEPGQGALITGSNNRDIAEIWNISSSSSSDAELESLYRAQGQGQGARQGQGWGRGQCEEGGRGKRQDSVRSDAVEVASQGTARTNRTARSGGGGGGTGHYAMPLNRHAHSHSHSAGGGLRQEERLHLTAPAPWSGHSNGGHENSSYAEETGLPPSQSRQFGTTISQTTGPGSPAGVRPRSSKVLTPSRRPVSTPKVRVPLASQSAVTPEAQIQALVARIAVRNEADEYIASLKKSLIK